MVKKILLGIILSVLLIGILGFNFVSAYTTDDCVGIGGIVAVDGNYCVHTFTASSSFNMSSLDNLDVTALIVAGGGGGGGSGSFGGGGSGGGAGGLLYEENITISPTTNYDIIIGDGGSGGTNQNAPTNAGTGGNTTAFGFEAGGGGGGTQSGQIANSGGSGGGEGAYGSDIGLGIAGQGHNGGTGIWGSGGCGGGGGAGEVGHNAITDGGGVGGEGGEGLAYDINGSLTYYAGGGGGGSLGGGVGNIGGLGGGGDSGTAIAGDGENGLVNTGGGGGGAMTDGTGSGDGGAGGSGIVIVRYFISEEEVEEQIYNITTCIELQNMSNNLTGNYLLMNNIDCSDTINWNSGEGFIPVGNDINGFLGTFDGQGFNITDLFINRSADWQGLFGVLGVYGEGANADSIIQNVGLINVSITGNISVGGIVGDNSGFAISNCYTTGNVNENLVAGLGETGGLVGTNEFGVIDNCYSTANINGQETLGGLVGGLYAGNITNSYATGNINGNDVLGGLIGSASYGFSWINNSYATGNVNGVDNSVGGLIGLFYAPTLIENSYATGNVSGTYDVGGLIGRQESSSGIITNLYSTGNVIGSGDNIGGLIGYNLGIIENSYATGEVIGTNYVGGLTGYSVGGDIIINNCSFEGNVTGLTYDVGGLVGYFELGIINNSHFIGNIQGLNGVGGLVAELYDGNITNSYATGNLAGNITDGEVVGGLVGYFESVATIDNSFFIGNITGDDYIGGLTGQQEGGTTITNSYSQGNITGYEKVGGISGTNFGGLINNSYSIANVQGTLYTSALTGTNAGTCINSFWNEYLSEQETSSCGTQLTNTEMLNQTSYTDWDFTNIWNIEENSTPYLRFNPMPFFPNFPAEEEIVTISSVSYETPITLNGGTTKDIYISFITSSASVIESSAQIIIINGAENRTSSSCTNISTEFNCTITMQFYDNAGSWDITAQINDTDNSLIENTTESFIVNALNYVIQDITYVNWASLIPNTNDNEADNTITLTNGGNQDYTTTNIKAYDLIGNVYAEIINASQFSIDNLGGQTTGQIYMQNDTNVDVSSKINLNAHNSSVTAEIFFYIDVPVLKADNYNQLNSWEISLS